jgi:hypothetical protein
VQNSLFGLQDKFYMYIPLDVTENYEHALDFAFSPLLAFPVLVSLDFSIQTPMCIPYFLP